MKTLNWVLLCCAIVVNVCLSGGDDTQRIYGYNYFDSYGNLYNTPYRIYRADGSQVGQFLSGQAPYLAIGSTFKYITEVHGSSVYGEDFTGTWGDVIKHQYWLEYFNQAASTVLGYNLSVQVGITSDSYEIDAKYLSVRAATLQVGLDGVAQTNSGIYFWDPWKVTNTGWPPEQTTVWNPYSSQFTPGTGNYSSYGGVFQNIPYDPSKSYYSVKTDATKTIDASSAQFMNWTASGAGITSPTSTQTPVTFSSANAVVTANYKGNLRTNAPTLGDSKNQRRVQISGYKWIMSYESMGEVWLTSSGDGGVTWDGEQRLSGGTGAASNPSISNLLVLYDGGGNPYYYFMICWLESGEVHFQSMNSGAYGGGPYFGWVGTGSSQNSSNHVTSGISCWYLGAAPQSTARPVVQLSSSGGNAYITYAFEGVSAGVITGQLSLPIYNSVGFMNDIAYASIVYYNGAKYRTVSSQSAAQQPVIITSSPLVLCLSGSSPSSLGIVSYDYYTNTTTSVTIPPNTNYQSLQGAINDQNGHYTIVGQSSCPPYNYPQVDTFKWGAGTGFVLTMTTRWGGHQQPSVMIDQFGSYGNLNPCVTGKQIFTSYWDKLEGTTQSTVGNNFGGVYTRERVQPGDRVSMVTRTTAVSNPPKLQRYDGSTVLQKTDGSAVLARGLRRYWNDGTGWRTLLLDVSKSNVEAIDSLEKGSVLCAIKILNTGATGDIAQRNDSLHIPLGINVLRNGVVVRSFRDSPWEKLTAENLGGIQSGDVIIFTTLNRFENLIGFEELTPLDGTLKKDGAVEGDKLAVLEKSLSVYPNPFNPTTMFRIDLPQPEKVRLAVYNLLGQQVGELINGELDAGEHFVPFDGHNLSSGVYFYRMEFGNKLESGRMLLMK
jgi:hypothetical protein